MWPLYHLFSKKLQLWDWRVTQPKEATHRSVKFLTTTSLLLFFKSTTTVNEQKKHHTHTHTKGKNSKKRDNEHRINQSPPSCRRQCSNTSFKTWGKWQKNRPSLPFYFSVETFHSLLLLSLSWPMRICPHFTHTVHLYQYGRQRNETRRIPSLFTMNQETHTHI